MIPNQFTAEDLGLIMELLNQVMIPGASDEAVGQAQRCQSLKKATLETARLLSEQAPDQSRDCQ